MTSLIRPWCNVNCVCVCFVNMHVVSVGSVLCICRWCKCSWYRRSDEAGCRLSNGSIWINRLHRTWYKPVYFGRWVCWAVPFICHKLVSTQLIGWCLDMYVSVPVSILLNLGHVQLTSMPTGLFLKFDSARAFLNWTLKSTLTRSKIAIVIDNTTVIHLQ